MDEQQGSTVTALRSEQVLRSEQAVPDVVPQIVDCNRASKAHEKLYSRAKQASDIVDRASKDAAKADRACDDADANHETIQAEDPDRRAPRPRQWLIAAGALALDGVACYFAAEALGSGQQETLAWALLFLALLGIGEVALDHYSDGREAAWRLTAAALSGFVVLLGVLRYSFLATVGAEGLIAATVGATLFTIATTGFLLIGYRSLRLAETGQAWRARRQLRAAQQAARAAHAKLDRRADRRDALARAYLSRIRLHLIQTCPGVALAPAEKAIWAHLTGKDM